MATLIRHKSGIYYLVTCVKGKRSWRSLRTRNQTEAYRIYLGGQASQRSEAAVSLLEAESEHLAYIKTNFSPKTLSVYKSVFKNFNAFLGVRSLKDISTRDLDFYKTSRATKVLPVTVNQDIRTLRAFFNRLKVWGYIDRNPLDGVRQIRLPDRIRPYLSKEDLGLLLRHLSGTHFHDMVLFAAMTGLRRGEILHLTWEDVDLNNRTVLVKSSLNYKTKGGRIRVLPMNSTVCKMLESKPTKTGLVFPGERGGKGNGDFISKKFKEAVHSCGLAPSLHFHSLRHTFASLLVKQGVSLYQVQKLLGHSSPQVTEVYAHLQNCELHSVVGLLDKSTSDGSIMSSSESRRDFENYSEKVGSACAAASANCKDVPQI